jgi:hypothetical protein
MTKHRPVGRGLSSSRTKIGTLMDERLFRRLKVHAAAQSISISMVIEDSVHAYLREILDEDGLEL